MDHTRFRHLIDIVGDALEQPAPERQAWLRHQCGDDVALLTEALSLLAESDTLTKQDLTARLEAGVARASADAMTTDRAGERAGAYRLIDVIGTGGMGTVYRAERADDQYRARVAIKFMRGALAAPQLERRFRAERQILADLSHPTIAWVALAGRNGRFRAAYVEVAGVELNATGDESDVVIVDVNGDGRSDIVWHARGAVNRLIVALARGR